MPKKPTKPTTPVRPPPVEEQSAAMAATAPRAVRRPAKNTAPPKPPTDVAKLWQRRLSTSNKQYDKWAEQYECSRLDKYYEGKQWHGLAEDQAAKKYVINLVFATVEAQLPSLLFSHPKVNVRARPSHEQTANTGVGNRATLIKQALQTFIEDPKLAFTFETTLSLRDAYSRFSLVEVDYTADWIDNPNAGKPVLNERDEVLMDGESGPITQPAKLPAAESLYVTRLVPEQFRAYPGRNRLETNDWAAYYDWYYVEDIKKNPDYQNTEDLKTTATLISEPDDPQDADDVDKHAGQVKVWKIWDLRQKVRHVLADGHTKLLQENKPFTTFPIADLKFFERRNAYYPLPPIYNWLAPQDEFNESREQQKVHRRRFTRRYMREPQVKDTEFEKLEAGDDGVCIEVPKVNPSPIMPIPDAPLDGANWTHLAATKEDFGLVSGVSGEARNSPEADTATQANIVNVRQQLREASARLQVANWLGRIARLMLLAMREHMQLPFMVKQTVDPFSAQQAPADVQSTFEGWQQIKAEDLDDLDVDVSIDVASLSPVAEDAERQQWNMVLQLVTSPPLIHLLMTADPEAPNEPSPLLRKTLSLNGISNDQEIRAIWRIGKAALAEAAQAAQAANAPQPEHPKISYAFKGEDILMSPLIRAEFIRACGLQDIAAQQQLPQAQVPPSVAEAGPGSTQLALPPGPTTGTPAKAASVVG